MSKTKHILQELEELEQAGKDDAKRDKVTLAALIAIGRIVFGRFDNIDERLIELMSELEDAQAAVAAVKTDVSNVQTKIADLIQQIADLQGGAASVAELKAGLAQIATDLGGVNTDLDAVAPDAPTP